MITNEYEHYTAYNKQDALFWTLDEAIEAVTVSGLVIEGNDLQRVSVLTRTGATGASATIVGAADFYTLDEATIQPVLVTVTTNLPDDRSVKIDYVLVYGQKKAEEPVEVLPIEEDPGAADRGTDEAPALADGPDQEVLPDEPSPDNTGDELDGASSEVLD